MKLWVSILLLAFLAGCTSRTDRAPPRPLFDLGGVPHEWALAHGKVGGLILSRLDGTGRGTPVLVMTCDDSTRGGLQVRFPEATAGPMRLQAGDKTFQVEARQKDDLWAVQGEGRFPAGWFEAFAAADTLRLSYGTRALAVPAPGAPSVEHYARYCDLLTAGRPA